MRGTLPTELLSLAHQLEYLHIDAEFLTDTKIMFSLTALTYLDVGDMRLDQPIGTTEWLQLSNLKRLFMNDATFNTDYTIAPTELGALPLTELGLQDTDLRGTVPSEWKNLNFDSLDLARNKFFGGDLTGFNLPPIDDDLEDDDCQLFADSDEDPACFTGTIPSYCVRPRGKVVKACTADDLLMLSAYVPTSPPTTTTEPNVPSSSTNLESDFTITGDLTINSQSTTSGDLTINSQSTTTTPQMMSVVDSDSTPPPAVDQTLSEESNASPNSPTNSGGTDNDSSTLIIIVVVFAVVALLAAAVLFALLRKRKRIASNSGNSRIDHQGDDPAYGSIATSLNTLE